MGSEAIFLESRVPWTKGVFFLGCFERRVTLYSQQVRALNLVDAILETREILPPHGGRVAVIGGGASGLTTAAAFARSGLDLAHIDLYERTHDLMHLQRECRDRYLHPRLYDWPRDGSTERDAKLPIMTWTAGSAKEVAAQLWAGFEEYAGASSKKVQVHTGQYVSGLKVQGASRNFFKIEGIGDANNPYDVVVLCIGFGYEIGIDKPGAPSYWDRFPIAGAILAPPSGTDNHKIFISGNGDGGLADLVLSAFVHMSHQDLHEFVLKYLDTSAMDDVRRLLLEVEEFAWKDKAFDVFEEYKQRVEPLLLGNSALMEATRKKLRADAEIWFHVAGQHLFKRESSILNRLLAYLAILADKTSTREAMIHLCRNALEVPRDDGKIEIEGNEPFVARYTFRRYGPDKEKNLRPFIDLADRMRKRDPAKADCYPQTPELSESAWRRFKHRFYENRRFYVPHGKYDHKRVAELAAKLAFSFDKVDTYEKTKKLCEEYSAIQMSNDAALIKVDDDPFLMDMRYKVGEYLACTGNLIEGNELYEQAFEIFKTGRTKLEEKDAGELHVGLIHQLRGHIDEHQEEVVEASFYFGVDSPRALQAQVCSACRMIAKRDDQHLRKAEGVLKAIGTRVGAESAGNPFLRICYELQCAKLYRRRAQIAASDSERKGLANEALKVVNVAKRWIEKNSAIMTSNQSVYVSYLWVCELMAKGLLPETDQQAISELRHIVRQLVGALPRDLAFCHFTEKEMTIATGVARGPQRLLSRTGG